MSNNIQIRHITDTSEFKTLKEPWNALLKQNHIDDAFLTWEWLFSWWRVFNQGLQLWIITAWRSNQLVGIAPLMLKKRGKFGFNANILCTLGSPMNDVGGFIVQDQNDQIIEALSNYIIEQKEIWDIFELSEFPIEGPEIEAIKAAFKPSNFSLIEKHLEHYYLPTETDWDKYYKSLSKKFRKNLRRAERNANDLGEITVKRFASDQLSWKQFESIIELNQHSNYPRVYESNLEQNFLKELFACASQWLVIYLLYADENPIAYEYGFLYNNCFEDWRAGFDTRIDPSISVGKLLSMHVTKDCFNRNCIAIDYMRGAHEYKTEWQPNTAHFKEVRIFRHWSLMSAVAYFWLKTLKPVLKRP